MEPEDGLIWVYGPDGKGTAAFSNFGVKNLEDIIRERRHLKSNARVIHRMHTSPGGGRCESAELAGLARAR